MLFANTAAPFLVALLARLTSACDSCYGPINPNQHVRHVKRIQPGSPSPAYGPTRPLEWGQLNFMHTVGSILRECVTSFSPGADTYGPQSDTHGWLAGHLKEGNYGADWGDFVSFTRHMKHRAKSMGVDLLLVDTGDLHDGTGFSDATPVSGELSINVFNEADYDLLTIGKHLPEA
jgi:hypothetical protein